MAQIYQGSNGGVNGQGAGRNVSAAKPETFDSAKRLAKKLYEYNNKKGEKPAEIEGKKENDNKKGKNNKRKGRQGSESTKKQQTVTVNAGTTQVPFSPHAPASANPSAPTQYSGTLPKCNKCGLHHNGECREMHCTSCNRKGHTAKYCRTYPLQSQPQGNKNSNSNRDNNNNNNTNNSNNNTGSSPTCYRCGRTGHIRQNCPNTNNPGNAGTGRISANNQVNSDALFINLFLLLLQSSIVKFFHDQSSSSMNIDHSNSSNSYYSFDFELYNIESFKLVPYDKLIHKKPFKGLLFDSLDIGLDFYKTYGQECGFDVNMSSQKRYNDGTIRIRYSTCSRSGFTESFKNENVNVKFSYVKRRRTSSKKNGCTAVSKFKNL
ncbi:uncharacterized protein LOC128132832 [Lactuca sativa]|uniref:uncharacterized protein LOC128132832 n=1 Tax=Lactuca sativa TaxID=4236 RepID=UPI0022AEBC06|nr:uncharacterized protein LOC128132832 [Lactuca sativa]